MFIYDSVKKTKLEFKSLIEGKVSLYVCGPTVYDDAHLGHAKSALAFDLLSRVLEANGYEVFFARNITDIDDKIINKAREVGVTIDDISTRYTDAYHRDMGAIGVRPPTLEPKATESIDAMIEMIQKLLSNKHAYTISNGDVYFDTTSDKNYLTLSNRQSSENISRVEKVSEKRNEADFALWKAVHDDSVSFDSPFGPGRPGWHLECSAMIEKYLPNKGTEYAIDIHGGGADLLFPHHENEAAQTRCATNHELARYWMHNGFINVDGEKMSKSLGNSFFLKDALKAYNGEVLRFYLLSTHYRGDFNFNEEDLIASKKRLDRLYRLKKRVFGLDATFINTEFSTSLIDVLSDDLNVSKAYSLIDELISTANDALDANPKDKNYRQILLSSLSTIQTVLGFGEQNPYEYFQFGIDEVTKIKIDDLIKQRSEAKSIKDFSTSDAIREELTTMNVSIMDTTNGTFLGDQQLKEIYKRYWPYIKGYRFHYFLVLVGILLTVTATAGTAHIMQPIMDNMFINKDPKMLTLIPLLLIGIYLLKSLGRYLQSVYTNYIGLHIISRLREDLLEKIIYMDMRFLYMNRSGELISRITNDLSRVQYFVSSMLPELIRESITVVALVGYVIWLNPVLAFWSLIVMPVIIVPLISITKRLKKLSHRSQEKNADVMTRLTEVFNNGEIIKANATEDYELKHFKEDNEYFFNINMKSTYTNELVSPLMEIIAAIGLAAVIYVGGREVYAGKMSVGEFTAFLTAVGLVFQPLRRVSSIYGKIQDALAASERVFHIFDIKNAIQDGPETLSEPIENVEFNHVTLMFGEKKALDDLNLSIHAGQNIALVGQSGGGKSSLVNLLLRFYDADKGQVNINHRSIKDYTQNSLRHQIASVSQRVYIFQDTLAANVAYGSEIDESKVLKALKMSDALEFAQSLPEGIYTMMQEFGANLSGGQRQRIAIARAIYKHASLLILDEATSALDNETEKRIQNALHEYSKDKITITIAHRLSTIMHADIILYFESGKIIASGTHQSLLENSEAYRRLTGEMD